MFKVRNVSIKEEVIVYTVISLKTKQILKISINKTINYIKVLKNDVVVFYKLFNIKSNQFFAEHIQFYRFSDSFKK